MKKNIASIILVVCILVAHLLLILTKADLHIDNVVEDLVYQSSSSVFNTDIYVIGIDAKSMSEYGQYETWSRTKIAELINKLCADEKNKPAVIGLDIGYFYERGEEEDQMLVDAVKNAGNVVLIETYEFTDKNRTVNVCEQPFEALREVARGVGFSNTQMDDDGIMRHSWGAFEYNGTKRNSFAMEIYRVYLEEQGLQFDETANGYYSTEKEQYYLVYAGEGGFYYGSAGAGNSISRVLSGEIPTREFKDAIVLVGAYAESTMDNYFTSNDKTAKMYGVEIHANAVNQLINGDYKTEITFLWRLLFTLGAGIIAILIVICSKNETVTILVLLACSVLYVGVTFLLDRAGNVLLPIVEPTVVFLAVAITALIEFLLTTQRSRDTYEASLRRFLSKDVADIVIHSRQNKDVLSPKKTEIAVIFVDIRGFTSISETLDPVEVVDFLGGFYKLTTEAIKRQGGTIDKFIGDNTMGFFNAPIEKENYTLRAVRAGLEMISSETLEKFEAGLADNLKGRIGFGVGIHVGPAVVGNMGYDGDKTADKKDEGRREYTAIGDTVNVASRLEGQAGRSEVVVSEEIYTRLKSNKELEFYNERLVRLKGKATDSKIYNVRYHKEDVESSQA